MKRGAMKRTRARAVAVIGAGALALAMAGPVAAADPAAKALAASRTCRKTIAGEMAKLAKLGNVLIGKCHKAKMKVAASRTNCNVIDSADMDPPVLPVFPSGKYDAYKQKAHDKIALKCAPGDPELGNFQAEDAFARLLPIIEGELASLAVKNFGDDTIDGNEKLVGKPDAKCVNSIAKWHFKLFNEVLKDSNTAQKLTDKTATVFGRILDANVDAGDLSTPLAVAGLTNDCDSVSGIDSCTNATSCLDNTRARAQSLTRKLYHGNNVCEPLGGTRIVEITIHTPESLAGMKVDLDYPQYETGLVGTEQSQLVSDAVALTHTDPGMFKVVNDRETDLSVVVGALNPFILDGDKVTITFDACVAKERNMCNRAQQVVDCAIPTPPFNDNPTVCTFPGPLDVYPEGPIIGTPSGCCPSDNACFPQSLATTCSVTDPVRANGTNVSGVTCTVAISGT